MGTVDLLVGLANDHGTMKDRSQDEQALIRIQHDWAEARVKGDSSFTRRLEAEDCTIVWPDGKIVNKRADLQTMTGNIVFSEFKINDLQVRIYGETGIVVGQGNNQRTKRTTKSGGREIRVDRCLCETGWRMESRRFADHSCLGKIIAASYP